MKTLRSIIGVGMDIVHVIGMIYLCFGWAFVPDKYIKYLLAWVLHVPITHIIFWDRCWFTELTKLVKYGFNHNHADKKFIHSFLNDNVITISSKKLDILLAFGYLAVFVLTLQRTF